MRQVKKDSTNVSVELYILDSSDGTPEIGVAFNTSGIDMNYRRDAAAVTSIAEITLASLTTAHADGGFLEIGNGRYRLDVPDAAFATGVSQVTVGGTVTGMIVVPIQIQLVDFDPDDPIRLGMTSLPAAAADAAGGLAISDAGGFDLDALNTQLADIPTVAEFTARTRADADYFSWATDVVARVTLVDTTTVNTDMVGTTGANTVVPDAAGTAAALHGVTDGLITTVDAVVDAILVDTNELQTDWVDGGRLDLIQDIIAADTTTDIPALIATAQADLDIITGTDGANLLSATQTTIDAIPTLAEILAGGDIDGFTLEETLKLCLSALASKLSGAATTTITIRSADDTANRITATVDADGNRSAVTLNAAG